MPRKKYIPSQEHLKAVEQMANKGVSHAKMAKALKISYRTFQRNLASFDEYIKAGKDKVDEEAVQAEIELVENALLQRCTGHEYTETVTEKRKVGQGEAEVVHLKMTKKFALPSVTAQMYYLGNRAKSKWQSVNYAKNEEKVDQTLTRDETLAFMNEMTVGAK